MATSPDPAQEVTLFKHVQELAINGDEPPSRYIRRDRDRDNDGPTNGNASLSSSSIPIVDLHLLSSPSSSTKEKEEEMEKLRLAFTSWGLFQAIGHDIPGTLLDEMLNIAKKFFQLSMDEKHKYAIIKDGTQDYLEGYGNDLIVSEDQVLEWSDRLYLLVKPDDQRNLKLWPENPNDFSEKLHEYSTKVSLVYKSIMKITAKILGLEENTFLNQCGERGTAFTRFNYYPPCSRPDLVYGVRPHSDGGSMTIVLQDKEVEGLQVLKDGQWFKVPIIPHALLVNVADQIEIMTNGVLKSPIHKVIPDYERERFSLATFFLPEMENEIEPASKLIDESRPRLFRKVKMRDYADVYFKKNSLGERTLDWAKV